MDDDAQRLKTDNYPEGLVMEQEDVFVAPVQPVNMRTATTDDVILMRKQVARDVEYMYGRRLPQLFKVQHGTSICLLMQFVCFVILFLVARFVLDRHHADASTAFGIGFIPFPVSVVVSLAVHRFFKLPTAHTLFNCFTGFVSTIIIMIVVMYFGNVNYQKYDLTNILAEGSSQALNGCDTAIFPATHFLSVEPLGNWSVLCMSKPLEIGLTVFVYVNGPTAYCVSPLAFRGASCFPRFFAICSTPSSDPCSKKSLAVCEWDKQPTEFFLNEDFHFGDHETEFDFAIVNAAATDAASFQVVWRGADPTYFRRLMVQLNREGSWGSFLMFVFFIVVILTESLFSKWIWPSERLHTIGRWNAMLGDQQNPSSPPEQQMTGSTQVNPQST